MTQFSNNEAAIGNSTCRNFCPNGRQVCLPQWLCMEVTLWNATNIVTGPVGAAPPPDGFGLPGGQPAGARWGSPAPPPVYLRVAFHNVTSIDTLVSPGSKSGDATGLSGWLHDFYSLSGTALLADSIWINADNLTFFRDDQKIRGGEVLFVNDSSLH